MWDFNIFFWRKMWVGGWQPANPSEAFRTRPEVCLLRQWFFKTTEWHTKTINPITQLLRKFHEISSSTNFLPWFREPGVFCFWTGEEIFTIALQQFLQVSCRLVRSPKVEIASLAMDLTNRWWQSLEDWNFGVQWIICQYVQIELQLQSLTIVRIFWERLDHIIWQVVKIQRTYACLQLT